MRVLRSLFGPIFVLAGLNHFLNPRFYLRIMPPWLPAHDAMNRASGLAEILGGAAVICPGPRVRRFGGWLSVATLLGGLGWLRDVGMPLACRIGPMRRLMTASMAGVASGFFGRREPLPGPWP